MTERCFPLCPAGEAAGLRIPLAARNRWKQPLHLMHGTVCRSQAPPVRSSGKHAEELEDGPSEWLLAWGRGGWWLACWATVGCL